MKTFEKSRENGFTLVEFIVAMGITLVILGTTVAVFRDAMKSNTNVSMRADMTDNLRAGMNLIQQDLIQTGTGIPTGGIPIPNTPNASSSCNIGQPVNRPVLTGTATFPVCNFVLPAINPGSTLGPKITSPDASSGVNTDILTVLYADNSLALDQDPITRPAAGPIPACNGSISATGDSVTFDSACVNLSAAGIQLRVGDLIMFSNVKGNALQTVTDLSGQTLKFAKGDAFNLNQRPDTQGTIKQLQNSTCDTATPPVCTPLGTYPPTTATRIWMISYYLDNVADPAHVRLVRRINFNPGQPVGETLENLQFTFNYVDGVTNPANQPSIPAGLSENQIRSVNLYLGARSTTPAQMNNGPNKFLRNSFQTQVSLRSMAYVNRYK